MRGAEALEGWAGETGSRKGSSCSEPLCVLKCKTSAFSDLIVPRRRCARTASVLINPEFHRGKEKKKFAIISFERDFCSAARARFSCNLVDFGKAFWTMGLITADSNFTLTVYRETITAHDFRECQVEPSLRPTLFAASEKNEIALRG